MTTGFFMLTTEGGDEWTVCDAVFRFAISTAASARFESLVAIFSPADDGMLKRIAG